MNAEVAVSFAVVAAEEAALAWFLANVSTDPVIPEDDKLIVSEVLTDVLAQSSIGNDVASPLTTPNSQTVEVINLKTYEYTLNINLVQQKMNSS